MSPFQSEKQRRWMWANESEIAKRWTKKKKKKRTNVAHMIRDYKRKK